jgi:hypothetical protein
MRIEGYLERKEKPQRGRIKETFKATDKLTQTVLPMPEQA